MRRKGPPDCRKWILGRIPFRRSGMAQSANALTIFAFNIGRATFHRGPLPFHTTHLQIPTPAITPSTQPNLASGFGGSAGVGQSGADCPSLPNPQQTATSEKCPNRKIVNSGRSYSRMTEQRAVLLTMKAIVYALLLSAVVGFTACSSPRTVHDRARIP
jgi:hypothetical protein